MKFVIAVVFCLAASQAFAFPSFDDFEETQEFESAVAEAGEEEFVRVERNTYGHGGYEHHVQPVHHQVHAYAAHAPKVECGSNLLVGCHPVVAKVILNRRVKNEKNNILNLLRCRSLAILLMLTVTKVTHTDINPLLTLMAWQHKNGNFYVNQIVH